MVPNAGSAFGRLQAAAVAALFLFALPLPAAKNAHPRLLGLSSVGIGAADGSTAGSLRWKAAHNTADWVKACADADSWYASYYLPGTVFAIFKPSTQSQWAYAKTLALLYLTLNGFTGTQTACQHTGAQYGDFGLQIGRSVEAWLNGINTAAYQSGGTFTGASGQTCTVSGFNDSSAGSAATLTLTGTNTVAAGTFLAITNPGTGSSANAASAVLGSGTATCSGTIVVASTYGRCGGATACNASSRPPYYSGNDFRGGEGSFIDMAPVFDYLYPLLSGADKIAWVTTMEQSAESVMLSSCPVTCTYKQSYSTGGVGPNNNGYEGYWGPIGIMGEAIIGDEIISNHSTTTCVHGEASCNDLTTNYLSIWINNIVPWWTTQSTQQNTYPNPNSCDNTVTITASAPLAYAGGKGCAGPGGFGNDGIEYGPQTQDSLLTAAEMISSADTATNLWNDLPGNFANEQARSILHITSPATSTLGWVTASAYEWNNFGDQQGNSQFQNNPIAHETALILGAKLGNTNLGSNIRYYAANVIPCMVTIPCASNNNKPTDYADLLYADGTGLSAVKWSSATEPLDWFSMGENWMLSLSDDTSSATWVSTMNPETLNNHQQSTPGEIQIYSNGNWLLLHPPGYGNQWASPNTHNVLVYQGPNEVNSGIWKGPQAVAFTNGPPSVIANEIDPAGRFTHIWYDMTPTYQSTKLAFCKTSAAVFTGTGSDDFLAGQTVSSCPPAPHSYHYQILIDGTAVSACSGSDSFKWRKSIDGASYGAYTTGQCITGACTASGCTQKMVLDGVATAQWYRTTGHTLADLWEIWSDYWGDYFEATKIQREFTYIKPNGTSHGQYIVEFSRAQFRNASDNLRSLWNLPYSTTPVLSGGVIASRNNGGYLWITPTYSVGGAAAAIQDMAAMPMIFGQKEYRLNGCPGAGTNVPSPLGPCAVDYANVANLSISNVRGLPWYQATISSASGASSQVMANVVQVANSNITPSATEAITATGAVCIHIKDPVQDQIVCHSSDPGGALISLSSPVTYTLTKISATATHYLVNLPANTTVKVQVADVGSSSTTTISNSSGSGTALTTSSMGSLVIPDPLAGAALSVFTSALAPGISGSSYSQTLAALGGTPPYTWSIASGTLQSGLSLGASSGAITGSTTQTGAATIQWKVTDGVSATATATIPIVISTPLTIPTTSLPGATTTVAYLQTVAAAGGNLPYTCTISVGVLPAGLSATPASTGCVIAGTPTGYGAANFTITAADATPAANSGPSSASQALTIAVASPITISPASLENGVLNAVYSTVVFAASGGTAPYNWAVLLGSLPSGMSLSSGGVLNGTPTTAGTYNFTIQVTDANTIIAQSNYALTIAGNGTNCATCSLTRIVLQ